MPRSNRLTISLAPLLLFASPTTSIGNEMLTFEWASQLGVGSGWGVSVDTLGNAYVASNLNQGASLSKFDSSGSHIWTETVGSRRTEESRSVFADEVGNIFVSGQKRTGRDSSGDLNWDAFVRMYDASGSLKWTQTIGSNQSIDVSHGVSADGEGNIYVTGDSNGRLGTGYAGGWDAYLTKYDSTGSRLWIRQLGSGGRESSSAVSLDSLGNVYITGHTTGTLSGHYNAGGSDAYIAKYNSSGTLLWTHQWGTSRFDEGVGVSVDNFGNVYFSGSSWEVSNGFIAEKFDAVLGKLDPSGNLLWTQQIATVDVDVSTGLSTDALGNVYVTGWTSGSLGSENAGGSDAFIAKYDESGSLIDIELFGTSNIEYSRGIWVGSQGEVYISGDTTGSLGGPHSGGLGTVNVFIAKYQNVPEPATFTFCLFGLSGLLCSRQKLPLTVVKC